MVSIESAIESLSDAAGDILSMMQAEDVGGTFANLEWASAMYDAHVHVVEAVKSLIHASGLDK